MKISGKELAAEVYEGIQKKLVILKKRNILPTLIIVKSSNIDAVNNYIGQKVKKGEKVGIKVEIIELVDHDCKYKKEIREKIIQINKSLKNHGIILQKPSNVYIDEEIESLIDINKDVDGFLAMSVHKPPVYRGVLKVLEHIFSLKEQNLISYLKTKKIVLIGKGKTGGQTVISGLETDGFDMSRLHIIDSKTPDTKIKEYMSGADIIVSAVGKSNPVDFKLFSNNTILIDIGVHFDNQNKIKGDFNEGDVKEQVSSYTTTPGGIGALTVAYLMDNVVNAAMDTIIN
ncbi:bifunctional 5,10-methylenetetrahydrofolate dehydrogenase/5,10-methenyltetrahydrofolate cyclohydrolase [Candidatus Roizmanbacteria bacterium]|nr:bifunctional 5,10-methylenetetrahydrofolate dehydrogenase/5,10-methenyltetrahydrofolate cyclohydrolase [Candidatus Roizmanbacteria bacterium]